MRRCLPLAERESRTGNERREGMSEASLQAEVHELMLEFSATGCLTASAILVPNM